MVTSFKTKINRRVEALAYCDSHYLAAATSHMVGPVWDGEVMVWDENGKLVKTFGSQACLSSVQWVNDSTIAAAGDDAQIYILSYPSGSCSVYNEHTQGVNSLSSKHNTLISASSDRSMKVWDIGTSTLVASLTGHSREVNSVEVQPGNGSPCVFASGGQDGRIGVWDTRAERSFVMQINAGHPVLSVSWIKNKPISICAGTEAGVTVLDERMTSGSEDKESKKKSEVEMLRSAGAVAGCSTGDKILIGSDDCHAHEVPADLSAEPRLVWNSSDFVRAVAYHPDNSKVAALGSWAGELEVLAL